MRIMGLLSLQKMKTPYLRAFPGKSLGLLGLLSLIPDPG
jgi:hypothetical protein